ncbi:MAG: hypothetical protein JXA96_13235 [Sedimentisphaerales bacterium]|nr:hypothetical protein [Sedimentisphaerales bacterium]
MNFDIHNIQKAQQTLAAIKYLMSVYIDSNIFGALDAIANEFLKKEEVEYSHILFHNTIAEYIQIASERTGLYGSKLTLEAAHREAIFLIIHFYRGLHGEGMDGALNDAINTAYNPMALVIANLNKALKDYACSKHIQAVKYHYIDSISWQMRYIMTQLLLSAGDLYLEPPMDTWSIERLSGCLFELIQNSMKNS